MSEAQARVCAAVLLLECPGEHPEGTEYSSKQLGEYFKIEPDGIRAAKRIWKDDGMQRKTTIDLFKNRLLRMAYDPCGCARGCRARAGGAEPLLTR